MATFPIGNTELDLQILGSGLRGGQIPPAPEPAPAEALAEGGVAAAEAESGDAGDLAAFEAVGWQFRRGGELDWNAVRDLNHGQEIEPGLLALRPSGRLAILRDRLVVQFKPQLDQERIDQQLQNYRDIWELGYGVNLYEVRLPPVAGSLEAAIHGEISSLAAKPEMVVSAEPSLLYHLAAPASGTAAPQAPQWQWDTINLDRAWLAAGANARGKGTRVAIIDHGFHAEDPGLQHVHLTAAFSVDGRAPVTSRAALPPHYHGTFCAGLVGANGADVHGAAPDCELILVAAPPHAVLSDVIMGAMLQYSADQGADVISCSLGPNSADWPLTPTLKPAIDYVGNTGRAGKGIPLAFASPDANLSMAANSVNAYGRLLSISQCDRTGQRVVSGFGPGLAFLAPGFRVAGILWENGTRTIGTMTGASLAAPCAAGVAALVLAVRQDLTWQQVINVLTQSCDPAAAGKQRNDDVGWGVLNAERAVRMAIAHP